MRYTTLLMAMSFLMGCGGDIEKLDEKGQQAAEQQAAEQQAAEQQAAEQQAAGQQAAGQPKITGQSPELKQAGQGMLRLEKDTVKELTKKKTLEKSLGNVMSSSQTET